MLERLLAMGLLRNLLQGCALVSATLLPFSSLPSYSDTWNLFFNGVLPATAPLIIIVLMLDVMMSQIWKDGADEARIVHLNLIIKVNCIVAAILLASFLMIFLPVLVG